jgi:hypothetical protein
MKKHDLPAMPVYWGDWFKALDVQALPRDIRCTWFEMLGRMWESGDRGYFQIAGRAPTDEEGARMLGFGADVLLYQNHIKHLEDCKIFSRNSKGIIYSRRMIKDEKIRQERALAGSKGMKKRWDTKDNKPITNTITNTEDEDEAVSERRDSAGLTREERIALGI